MIVMNFEGVLSMTIQNLPKFSCSDVKNHLGSRSCYIVLLL